MKQIAVMLASSQRFSNTGMFSVDLAAYEFFKSNFPDVELKFYVFHLSDKSLYPYEHYIPYKTYNVITRDNVNDIHKSDMIVYWGDFMHTRPFLEGYMCNHVFEKPWDMDIFFKAFFLEDCDKSIFKKTIMFGSSLLALDIYENQKRDRYALAAKEFFRNINKAMPRDVFSKNNLKSEFTSDVHNTHQGCDPAFFLEGYMPCNSQHGTIGVFMGRRNKISIRDLGSIISFALRKDLKIEWVPWMMNRESFLIRSIRNPKQAANLIAHVILEKIFKGYKDGLENDFDSLTKYNMIITDTYHLAINALKDGVPVFCISEDRELYENSISMFGSGDKKDIIFDSLGMSDSCGKPSVEKLNNAYYNSYFKTSYRDNVRNIEAKLFDFCVEILGEDNADI